MNRAMQDGLQQQLQPDLLGGDPIFYVSCGVPLEAGKSRPDWPNSRSETRPEACGGMAPTAILVHTPLIAGVSSACQYIEVAAARRAIHRQMVSPQISTSAARPEMG
jgi:hypothetical protein